MLSQSVSFSESSSTLTKDNQQENMAASSFIEYSGNFPDFLPDGASDISSINIDVESTISSPTLQNQKQKDASITIVSENKDREGKL